MKYHLISVRMAIIRKTKDDKCEELKKRETVLLWDHKFVQPLQINNRPSRYGTYL